MDTVTARMVDDNSVIGALQHVRSEASAGRVAQSDRLLAQLAQAAPHHPAVLNELGIRMLDRGSAEQANALFVRATTADPRHPALWANLASSLRALGRREEERDAIDKALELEPRHLSALLQKGSLFEETGDIRNAARTYQNALDCIPAGATIPQSVLDTVEHARRVVEADFNDLARALEEPLALVRARHDGRNQPRVDQCLNILMGRQKIYQSNPTWMYFPGLPAIEFFNRELFPWLDAFEEATEAIRSELMNVLVADSEGLQPYVDYPTTMPLDQWRELNRSRRWSAYFLWNQSEPIE